MESGRRERRASAVCTYICTIRVVVYAENRRNRVASNNVFLPHYLLKKVAGGCGKANFRRLSLAAARSKQSQAGLYHQLHVYGNLNFPREAAVSMIDARRSPPISLPSSISADRSFRSRPPGSD